MGQNKTQNLIDLRVLAPICFWTTSRLLGHDAKVKWPELKRYRNYGQTRISGISGIQNQDESKPKPTRKPTPQLEQQLKSKTDVRSKPR